MKLFGHQDSGHAYKVKLMLVVAGIDHQYEHVDIFAPRESRSAEFRMHARFGEVPLLIDGSRTYSQSNAILTHLATSTNDWGANDAATLNRCLEWLFWEANKIGMCLPQLRAANRFAESQLTKDAQAWLTDRYDHDIQRLDAEFADGRNYILGEQPTIADFSLCGYLFFADEAKLRVPKHVGAWLDRITQLPGWRHPYELLGPDG